MARADRENPDVKKEAIRRPSLLSPTLPPYSKLPMMSIKGTQGRIQTPIPFLWNLRPATTLTMSRKYFESTHRLLLDFAKEMITFAMAKSDSPRSIYIFFDPRGGYRTG